MELWDEHITVWDGDGPQPGVHGSLRCNGHELTLGVINTTDMAAWIRWAAMEPRVSMNRIVIFCKSNRSYKPGNTNWTIGEDTYFQSIPHARCLYQINAISKIDQWFNKIWRQNKAAQTITMVKQVFRTGGSICWLMVETGLYRRKPL